MVASAAAKDAPPLTGTIHGQCASRRAERCLPPLPALAILPSPLPCNGFPMRHSTALWPTWTVCADFEQALAADLGCDKEFERFKAAAQQVRSLDFGCAAFAFAAMALQFFAACSSSAQCWLHLSLPACVSGHPYCHFSPLTSDGPGTCRIASSRRCHLQGNLVPLYERMMADQLTPVLAYRCLVKEDDREAPSFLFESVTNGTQQVWGRRSSRVGCINA